MYRTLISVTWQQPDARWPEGLQCVRHFPTIYLSANTLGIVDSDHAEDIAIDMVKEVVPVGSVVFAHCYPVEIN